MINKRIGLAIGALTTGMVWSIGTPVLAETTMEQGVHIPNVATTIQGTQNTSTLYTYNAAKQSVVATDRVKADQVAGALDTTTAAAVQAAELEKNTTDKKTSSRTTKKSKKGVAENPQEKLPITVVADSMYYSDKTGAVSGNGRVDVTQGNRVVRTEHIEGNVKSSTYNAPGLIYYKEGPMEMNGVDMTYNSLTQNMTLNNGEGFMPPYYVRGNDIDYTNGVGHIKHGMVTTQHAMAWSHSPDYRVDGQDIEIIPNDRLTIKEAKFYIKSWHIMTLKSYTASLKRNKGINAFSFIPTPTYESTNGFGLHSSVVYPISERGELFYSYYWYSKVGFKPDYGYNYYTNWGNMSLAYRKEESTLNDTNVWIKKTPEFAISTKTYHLGKSPFTVNARGTWGYWEQGDVKGSHRLIQGELSHDPWNVTKDYSIRGFVGYQRDYYGANDSVRSMPYWGIQNNYKVSNRLNLWANYRQQNRGNQSPYTFDTDELKQRLDVGGFYQATRVDAFSLNVTWDMDNKNIKYKDLTYYRDMHSIVAAIQYRIEQKEWKIQFIMKDF